MLKKKIGERIGDMPSTVNQTVRKLRGVLWDLRF